jgi:hypothetical protein
MITLTGHGLILEDGDDTKGEHGEEEDHVDEFTGHSPRGQHKEAVSGTGRP